MSKVNLGARDAGGGERAELMGVDIANLVIERAGGKMVFPEGAQAWLAAIQRPSN